MSIKDGDWLFEYNSNLDAARNRATQGYAHEHYDRVNNGLCYVGDCIRYLADTWRDIESSKTKLQKQQTDAERLKSAALRQYAEDEYLRNRGDL